jgi:hypothetical protein
MRLQYSRTSTLSALLARLVDKSTSCASRSADLDLVLCALGRPIGIEAAALSNREEQVVVFTIQRNERSFLRMLALGLECERHLAGARRNLGRRVLHVDGEEVAPEGTVGHDEFGTIPVESAVDGVVVVAGFGGDARGAQVGPGVEVLAGSDTDSRGLDTKGGDGVVEVVCVADLGDVGCLLCHVRLRLYR